MTNFATYPDGIFKGIAKFILYTVIPVGLSSYIPVSLICKLFIVHHFAPFKLFSCKPFKHPTS